MPITIDNVLLAAFWATIIVFILRVGSRMFQRIITRTTVFMLRPSQMNAEELETLMQNCYQLFPVEHLKWEGVTFRRGNTLRIKTTTSAAIEGQFIGLNGDNMLCLMTDNSVIAQEMGTIEDIQQV